LGEIVACLTEAFILQGDQLMMKSREILFLKVRLTVILIVKHNSSIQKYSNGIPSPKLEEENSVNRN
jgi:hypothetical protein